MRPARQFSMSLRARIAFRSLVVLTILVPASASFAHSFTIDQTAAHSPVGGSRSIQGLAPIGQEFTPTLNGLDVVELLLQDPDEFNGVGSTLTVTIRSDSITGTVLGTSLPLALPNGFGGGAGGVAHFDFAATVPLTAGNLYVIEANATGDPNFQWMIHDPAHGLGFPGYSGGRAIVLGGISPNEDYWFIEGPVPEPSVLLLLSVGAVALSLHKLRPR